MIHRNPAEAFVAALAAGTLVVETAVEAGIAAVVENAAEVEIAVDGNAAGLGSSVEGMQKPVLHGNRVVAADAGWLVKEAGKDRTEAVVTDCGPAEPAEPAELYIAALVLPPGCYMNSP